MSWFEAIILGLVQGITEFLPISSSGHQLIVSQLFGWEDPGAAFTAFTQIGTEIATLDLSGAGSQELFLRFNSFNPGNTESWPVLDNVHIVPEPAAMALFGLALAGLLGFRRNRRN